MKYQKGNKSRIRENENNTLLDNDLGKPIEKKTKKKEKIPGADFPLKKTVDVKDIWIRKKRMQWWKTFTFLKQTKCHTGLEWKRPFNWAYHLS